MYHKFVLVWLNYYLITVYGDKIDDKKCQFLVNRCLDHDHVSGCDAKYALENEVCQHGYQKCFTEYFINRPYPENGYWCIKDKTLQECGPGAVYESYKDGDPCHCQSPAEANSDVSCNTKENCAYVNCGPHAVCMSEHGDTPSCYCRREGDPIKAFQCEVKLAKGNNRTPKQEYLESKNNGHRYINVNIYPFKKKWLHNTESMLQMGEGFTMTLQFSNYINGVYNDIEVPESQLHLTCYNAYKRTEISINQSIDKHKFVNYFKVYVNNFIGKPDFWKCDIQGLHFKNDRTTPLSIVFRANYELTRKTPLRDVDYTVSTTSITTASISTASITTPLMSATSIVLETTKPSVSDPTEQGDEQDHDTVMIVAIVVATLFLVMLIAWLFCRLHKRRQRLKSAQASSDINYENLPGHREGPMTLPPQWDTHARTHAHEENLYSVPYPEDMYTKPVPKLQRHKPPPPPPPVETPYAEILIEAGEENNKSIYQRPRSPMPAYSEIEHGINGVTQPSQRSDPAVQMYTNVGPGDRQNHIDSEFRTYTNEHGTVNATPEYVEPAYCELANI